MAVAEQQERETVRAQANYVHSSARKARLVTDLIRGRSVPEARTILAFSNRAVAKDVEKVLRSAVANAESRPDLHWNGDDLVVAAAYADEGPTLKRWRARARGRVARIRKRTCHITIELAQGAPGQAHVRAGDGGAERRAEARRPSGRRGRSRGDRQPRPEAADGDRRAAAETETDEPKPRRRPPRRVRGRGDRGEEDVVGQKIHPGGLRVGVIHDWKSNWYTGKKEFADYILEDVRIREHIYNKLAHAGLSDILIRKDKQRITVDIYTARPGIVIGKSGVEVDALRKELHALTQKNVHININEIKRPELDAKLVAQSIAEQLSEPRRLPARDEARARVGDPLGRGRREDPVLGPPGRRRDEPARDVQRGTRPAAHDPRRHRLRLRRGEDEHPAGSASRSGSTRARSCRRASSTGGDTRLGDQDTRRRRGGALEGLGASRESGRGRGPDREGLGPVRQRRRGQGGGGRRSRPWQGGAVRGGGGGRPRRGQQAARASRRQAQAIAAARSRRSSRTPTETPTPEAAVEHAEPPAETPERLRSRRSRRRGTEAEAHAEAEGRAGEAEGDA